MSFIVVGVDGSSTAFRALVKAVDQAKPLDAEVRIVTVVSYPMLSGHEFGPSDVQSMHDAADRTLANTIQQLHAHFGGSTPVVISGEVRTGHIGAEILRAAEADGGAAMIVAGSRGYGGFRSLMLGSVTTFLAHHMPCPLLIIPPEEDLE